MKTAFIGALAAGLATRTTSSSAQRSSGSDKTLVAYFSRSGNTRTVARHIRRIVAADLFEIEAAQPYPEDYEATVAQAQSETDKRYEPPLKEQVANIGSYGIIFLGFPIWGTTAPPVIRSFLSKHNLSGKTIVPFITHGGYGRGSSMQVLASLAPRAHIVEGFTMQGPQEKQTVAQVTQWLNQPTIRQLQPH